MDGTRFKSCFIISVCSDQSDWTTHDLVTLDPCFGFVVKLNVQCDSYLNATLDQLFSYLGESFFLALCLFLSLSSVEGGMGLEN